MTKTQYIFLLIIALLNSCGTENKNESNEREVIQINLEHEEAEIISMTLSELVKFKSVEILQLPRNIDESESEFRNRQKIAEEEYKKQIKENGLLFYLEDTLFVPKTSNKTEINDTMYEGLLVQLLSDTIKNQHLKLSLIHIPDSVNFLNERPSIDDEKIGYCGYAGFSRIIFNQKFDKAFFYFYKDCGYGICGSGHYILVEKKQGQWTILRNDEIWVS
jgi:hypothetical protein